jgi:hypothetical protein
MLPPIIIKSFNRPHFLEPTLTSLKAQAGSALNGRSIHLFQDGAVNRYSRIRYAAEDSINACTELFKKTFPEGQVHRSQENIGICENFYRAELFVFDEIGADCAYFFEDDLILSPYYIEMLDQLYSWAARQPNVAYFAAYGNYYAPPEEIAAAHTKLMSLDHHWAFGLQRRHWRSMQPLLRAYYDLVLGTDYARRDHRAICALYEAGNAAPRGSSQDGAKAFVCDQLGLWRCNTVQTFARYIGNVGQHMTKDLYAKLGFDRAKVASGPEALDFPTEAEIAARIHNQRGMFEAIRRDEYAGLLAGLPARKFNPVRRCTREDILYGYRLFLNREPENEEVVLNRVGRQTVVDFVRGLTASSEYAANPARHGKRRCTSEEVIYAYRLCLHRDPDGPHILEGLVDRNDRYALTRTVWSSPERECLWGTIETTPE